MSPVCVAGMTMRPAHGVYRIIAADVIRRTVKDVITVLQFRIPRNLVFGGCGDRSSSQATGTGNHNHTKQCVISVATKK